MSHAQSILDSLSSTIVAHPEGMGSMLVLTEGTSLRGTAFNLMNTILGAGILGLPHAAEQAGIIVAALMLILVALLQDLSAWMLLVSVDATKQVSSWTWWCR
jgi:amino acid permease